MSGVGKDGKAFDLTRWVNWAISPSTGNSRGIRQTETIRRTWRVKKRGGSRRACECGRMNPASQLQCKCGKLIRTKARSK